MPSIVRRASFLLMFSLAAAFAVGCATHYIPNTDVEDIGDNRQIITFCEKYRHAVEERDVPLLLSLASRKYYEDGGNVDARDDLDFAGLEQYLRGQFQKARAIRYEIRYRKVSKGPKQRIFVDFTYSASYKVPGLKEGDEEEWRHTVADNRLELVIDQRDYKILAGM